MQDRVPLYPGRVVLTPVSGQANTYDMTRADQPTQEGTPLNKASLLKDATAALFGLGSNAVPDDVLSALGDAALYKTAPQTAQLNTLKVGDVIYLNESGVPAPYIIISHGIPQNSPLYDSSCNGTWVLRKDVYNNVVWDAGNSNVLPGADIFSILSSLVSLYDSDVQSAIKTVKIPYCVGGLSSTINSGKNGLSCKIFPLSSYECGITTSQGSYPTDGALLDYFLLGVDSAANTKRISYFKGSPAQWWTRSPITNSSNLAAYFDNSGRNGAGSSNSSKGLRPAFILDPALVVVTKLPTTGLFDTSNNLLLQLPAATVVTGSYVGTGQSGKSNPNILDFDEPPKIIFIVPEINSDSYSVGILFPPYGAKTFIFGPDIQSYYRGLTVSLSGGTVKYYSSESSSDQLNNSGIVFHYYALF